MTKIIVEIFDKKMEEHQNCIVRQNRAIAIREFVDICKDKNSIIAKHPEDYKLIQLGVLDENKGIIDNSIVDIMEATDAVAINETHTL
jgi:hypothetical protein